MKVLIYFVKTNYYIRLNLAAFEVPQLRYWLVYGLFFLVFAVLYPSENMIFGIGKKGTDTMILGSHFAETGYILFYNLTKKTRQILC